VSKYRLKPEELEGYVITHVRCICQNSEYEVSLENGEKRFVVVRDYRPVEKGSLYLPEFDLVIGRKSADRFFEEVK
jgi:hypothetical protein